MLWIYLFSSLYLLVRLWWNILVTNLTTNFQDFVTKVKDLVALVPVLGAISCPDWPIRIKILKCIPLLSFLFVLQVIGKTISLLSPKNVLVGHVSFRISALIFPLTTRRLVEWSTSGGKVSAYLQCSMFMAN